MCDSNHRTRKASRLIFNHHLSQRQLAILCCSIFILSLLPLVIVAIYNYPADDDFSFTLPAATAWVSTHSLRAVLSAIKDHTATIYRIWQGDFTSTFMFALNPMVFNIKLYFLANWYILAFLCLSAGYLVKSITNHWLNASSSTFWIVYTAVMILMLQFMPNIGESIYWFNGGQYTVAACFMMLTLGLLVRCNQTQSKTRGLIRGLLLCFCGFILGGSFYGPALGAFVVLLMVCITSLITRMRMRWHTLATLAAFCIAFYISLIAPGNTVRQELAGESLGALATVFSSILDSFDLMGSWFSPQLIAMLLLIIPVLWIPLKESNLPFKHPLWLSVILYGMFAATLAPGIYSGAGYGIPRYLNATYLYFLIALMGSLVYAEGALIRWLERRAESDACCHFLSATRQLGKRFSGGYLALCLVLLTLGGFSNTIMNRPSINAVKVLVSGEAAQYYSEMQDRQEYIRTTNSDVVNVRTLSVTIPIFKHDQLPFQGNYGRVRYMKQYFELFHNDQTADVSEK